MSVKLVLFSALITLSIIGAIGLYSVIYADLQSLDAQQQRLLPDISVFDETAMPLEVFEGTQQLKQFSSDDEVREFLLKIRSLDSYVNYDDFRSTEWDSDSSLMFASSGMRAQLQSSSPSFARDWSTSAGSGTPFFDTRVDEEAYSGDNPAFSSTNVQVTGVDEPDYIKTDGKYIYVLQDRTLRIIDAYPAETAKIISKTTLDIKQQELHNMFLNGYRLVIFYTSSNSEKRIEELDNPTRRDIVTHAMILDVSDPISPKILKDYEVDGDFHDARMIGDYVYFISTMRAHHNNPVMPYITVHGSSGVVLDPDVFYFDNYESDYKFNTITAINIFDENFVNAKTFLMGSTNTIYTSQDGLYITYKKSISSAHHEAIKKDRFFNTLVPLLSKSVQDKINEIRNDSLIDSSKKHTLVTDILVNAYDSIGYVDKKTLFSNIGEQLAIYDSKVQQDLKNTAIHKIRISEGSIEHQAQGGVPGWLLNQFSMDKYKDSFRVVTTYDHYDGNGLTTRYNAVYVMDDEQLDTIGNLDGIAPNENVFASRFMGEKLYLVTFERIDPFFVIDLSSDTPKILGELKIPGFSTYLHPFDENHIVGIGRDADNFGIQQSGVKIALFDVSDVKKPSVVDDVVIGNSRAAGSEALDDHKAFFLDTNRGILSIPIYDKTDTPSENNSQNTWNGFYVYGLDPQSGFDLEGKIKHSGSKYVHSQTGYRTFYIGDALYTASPSAIKINALDDIQNEINSIRFDYPLE
ncbi:beta-propeller domain-containing protein [Nitrosopumilus ureiphilus]|uniref:Copper amine oxidase n=1 Tax=Nitrosopumilus ureiphilus TaxID=1470067 RepID=A0A7D5REV7_9ARCH|nr:beta-propeller domain-containing protein [Nitrosopumilus ureiphilus]QLH07363.1 copper amine oxidase [Nitrosopumilus ureiphilus]